MARDKRAPARAGAPEVEPQRATDRPGFYAAGWLDKLAWPAAFLGATVLVVASAIFVRYGADTAQAWLDFIAGPAFIAGVTALFWAAVSVVRKVRQMAKAEMWSATAASTAASTRAEVAELKQIVQTQPAAAAVAREPDPDTGEIKALVLQLAHDVKAIQANAASAAQAATSARDTVVGYGQSLQSIASSTGQLQARTVAAKDAAREALWTPPRAAEPAPVAPEATPAPTRRPEPRWEPRRDFRPEPTPHPFDTRYPHHRDATAEQPAVPGPADAGDEEEDWQDTGGGPGLDTSLIRGFRADAARLAAEEEERRRARAQPTTVPAWEPEPIRLAREKAEEFQRQRDAREQMRRRQSQWDNPEEGPR